MIDQDTACGLNHFELEVWWVTASGGQTVIILFGQLCQCSSPFLKKIYIYLLLVRISFINLKNLDCKLVLLLSQFMCTRADVSFLVLVHGCWFKILSFDFI